MDVKLALALCTPAGVAKSGGGVDTWRFERDAHVPTRPQEPSKGKLAVASDHLISEKPFHLQNPCVPYVNLGLPALSTLYGYTCTNSSFLPTLPCYDTVCRRGVEYGTERQLLGES